LNSRPTEIRAIPPRRYASLPVPAAMASAISAKPIDPEYP